MNYEISAKLREKAKVKNDVLREDGFIPAVMYGKNIDPQNISFEYNAFEKVYQEAGESNLIDLSLEDKEPQKVLVKDVQYDPITGKIIHIDFKIINMKEKIHTNIPFNFTGESPAVKELGGVLVKSIDELEVECLPIDLVGEIEVDISPLATFDDVIKIKDINIPKGMRVLEGEEEIVATVTPPRSEEELAALEQQPTEETDVSEVKVEGEEKKKEKETKSEKGAEK